MWFVPKSPENTLSCLNPRKKWSSPRFTGRGVFPSISFLLFFNDHVFSLSITPVTKLLPRSSGFTAECYLVFQMSTHRSLSRWRSYPSLCGTVGGPRRDLVTQNSQHPNINTTCDTPSQNAFKTTKRRKLTSEYCSVSNQSSVRYIKLSRETNWPWSQPKQSLWRPSMETHVGMAHIHHRNCDKRHLKYGQTVVLKLCTVRT